MVRDQIAGRVAAYADRIAAPVALETEVRRLSTRDGGGFQLETSAGSIEANEVVVATGSFHTPRIPAIAADLPRGITQLHSHDYRNEAALPRGAVLVVGSGQSGVQIAEELHEAGRQVFLSVGSAGRAPRRYRGSDFFRWLVALATQGEAYGVPLPTVDTLADPRMRQAGNPQLSGHGGGHDMDLRAFAASGMTLLGRIQAADGSRLELAQDLAANVAWADRFFDERFRPAVDTYIERAGIDAPPDDRVPVAFEPPQPADLDLEAAGISTVLWTTGYRLDYGWIDLPIFDEQGFPRHRRGVSEVPGLYFLGLLWQHTQASATLFGVGLDARHLAAQMGLPNRDDGLALP
jgi:putative flavoprotein involved in K+ transport